MRYFYRIPYASLLLLITACNSVKAPNVANFTKAINEYLMKHGAACTVISRQFPIDLPRSEQNSQFGIEAKLAALEQAGLVHSSDTTAVVHGMLDSLHGSGPAQPVKRYELTESGRKYFQQIPGALGQTSGFCYGQKSVDLIVKWKTGTPSQAEVTYTYKLADAAQWAQRPDVQAVFSDIRTTVNGASKTTEVAGLQLSNNGWEVPGT
jgi:hypothetical protein